jgi:hypothetical protein
MFIKFPAGAACLPPLLVACLFPFSWRAVTKKLAIAGTVGLLVAGAIWLGLYGTLGGIVDYFINGMRSSAGYSDVMSIRPDHWSKAVRFFGLAAATLLLLGLQLPRNIRIFYSLLLSAPLFIFWKHGIVRYDTGHIPSFLAMMSFAVFLISLELIRTRRSWLPAVLVLLIGWFLNQALMSTGAGFDPQKPWVPPLAHLWGPSLRGLTTIKTLAGLTGTGLDEFMANDARNLSGQKLPPEILSRIGSRPVDIYHSESSFLAANELNYRPKPVFQPYAAYTPELDRLNARFFCSPARPDFLILYHPESDITSVDGRHMLLDDPITSLEILNHYRMVAVANKPPVTLLEYNKARRFSEPTVFKRETVNWSRNVPVPEESPNDVFRVSVQVKELWETQVRKVVERLPPIHIVYVLADGTERKFRLVPPQLGSGVWVKPFLPDARSLDDFLEHKPLRSPCVTAIRFEGARHPQYEDQIQLAWERISAADGAYLRTDTGKIVWHSRNSTRGAIPIYEPREMAIDGPVAEIKAVQILLSTYQRTNPGIVRLEVVGDEGRVLASTEVAAATLVDNKFETFVFNTPARTDGQRLHLRLSYVKAAAEEGLVAAWSPDNNANDFNCQVFGR